MFKEKIKRRLSIRLGRAVQFFRIAFYSALSTNRIVGSPVRLQPIQAAGFGKISIGDDVKIGVFPSPFFYSTYAYIEARNPSASISIGAGTWINNNFCAIAEHTSITIGANCFIGTNVQILDSDFHGMRLEERHISKPEWAKPVVVGDNVFIGSDVKILKGVSIGSCAVIGSGSLVIEDIPAAVIAAGSPARAIRALD